MTQEFRETPARAILLDIEGTTTPLDFVTQVLFPYSRLHVKQFLKQHGSSDEVGAQIAALREEHAADRRRGLDPPALTDEPPGAQLESLVTYIHWLIDHDRKSTPLKALQGKIWAEGYESGELRSQVFADVPPAMERWRGQNKDICIFSSGSVLAQKLLFAYSSAGDLTRFIHRYFDTTTGIKTESESYRRIAAELKRDPSEITFVSDVAAELDAARSAGMRIRLCIRPGNRPQPTIESYPLIHTFDDLIP